MKRTALKQVSGKRRHELACYYALVATLRLSCYNKSELSGKNPDWQSDYLADPHHIDGKDGKKLYDPFNIIFLTRTEHDIQHGKVKGEKLNKEALLAIIRPIRVTQGFTLGEDLIKIGGNNEQA